MRNIKCLILNIKRSSSLTWWSFETCVCCKSTDKTRSTQGDHNTTEKTKGGLNIFPCVGSILWEYGRISTSCTAETLTSKTLLLDTPPIQMCARVIINASLNTKTGPFFKPFARTVVGTIGNSQCLKSSSIHTINSWKTSWKRSNDSTDQRWTNAPNRRSQRKQTWKHIS